jgi:hypothetical protein
MTNRYGYFTGVAIAIYSGMLYERHTSPEPCITNLSIHSYPNFEWEQIMLDNIVNYNKDSDMYRHGIKTSEELAKKLVEMSQDSNWSSSIYTNPKNNRKYYVPGLCYVGEVNFFGEPILYRK